MHNKWNNNDRKKAFSEFFGSDFEDVRKEFTKLGKELKKEFEKAAHEFKTRTKDHMEFYDKIPPMNLIETKDGYRMELAVPGYTKEDFKINLEGHNLTVSLDITRAEVEGEKVHRKEFDYSKFSRKYHLPEAANLESIEAKYDNGLLVISIHKKEEAKHQSRDINVE